MIIKRIIWKCCLMILSVAAFTDLKAQSNLSAQIKARMLAASKYMVETVGQNGGYVSTYHDDLSRRWGELEAYKSMAWVEGTGTVSMGELFLDAYDATGDEYYYSAAEKVADALAWGQHESGGWHYFINFAGEPSTREWYRTIGKNAWGFEEHNHYYGNATFDGRNTIRAAQFIGRIYLRKRAEKYRQVLERAIRFVLDSQYPLGAWPQRFPLKYDFPHGKLEDYSSFYTFNDDVISSNINFLIQCYLTLGQERFADPIFRGMNFYLLTQGGNPQAGWSKQHTLDLAPAHARTYEPAAIYLDFTYKNANLLLRFFELTGDRRFLARVPDAIKFLDSALKQYPSATSGSPIFLELVTNKPLYIHRSGTNVTNGKYWLDSDSSKVVQHYKGGRINLDLLRSEYQRLVELKPAELKERIFNENTFVMDGIDARRVFSHDFLTRQSKPERSSSEELRRVIKALDNQNRWLVKNQLYSLPYEVSANGDVSNTARRSDSLGNAIRDNSDQLYLSTGEFIKNMRVLMDHL